jgi:molybdenum cofactor cytidylyltransferase
MKVKRVAAIVLAAGGATRFGSPRQVALFRGEPLVVRATRNAYEAGASPIVVVTGGYSDEVSRALERQEYATVAPNANWQSGIASSLRTGIAAIMEMTSPVPDGVLLLTVDQPLVDASMLSSLIDGFTDEHSVVAAEYGSVVGVPALIGIRHLDDIARSVTGDHGAAAWLQMHHHLVKRVPFEAASFDANTIHTLRAIELSSRPRQQQEPDS